jgi:hypothetical protein
MWHITAKEGAAMIKRMLSSLCALMALSLASCLSFAEPAGGVPSLKSLLEAGPSRVAASAPEKELYRLIMAYRKERGLPSIPPSRSLWFVAQAHVRDLSTHTFAPPANQHSWSAGGPWKQVDYFPDHRNVQLMWSKPRELTKYAGDGFEIAHISSAGASPAEALAGWKSRSPHNAVIVNGGVWASQKWRAIGVGIYGNYAVAWFGTEEDPEGGPSP